MAMVNHNTWGCKTCAPSTTGLNIVPTPPIKADGSQAATSKLPAADYLVITWTEAETDAMARVMSNGQYRFFGLSSTENNFIPLKIDASQVPLPNSKELGSGDFPCQAFYFVTRAEGKSVICLKSNLHPKNETAGGKYGTALEAFIKWLIANNSFKFILTTGTSGAIWSNLYPGDVVVCNSARYDPNEAVLINSGKPKTIFTSTVNLAGALTGGKSQFDIMNSKLGTYASCAINTITPERTGAGPVSIYYAPVKPGEPNTVISDINFDQERNNIDNKNYASMGATFDNNDAFVAEACTNAGYKTWAAIRNISDLPGAKSDSTYDKYQDCSSIIGGLAAYAFIAGH